MTAPSFPQAADIPCAVDRYRVGNTSPGTINYSQPNFSGDGNYSRCVGSKVLKELTHYE